MNPTLLARLQDCRRRQEPVALVIDPATGAESLVGAAMDDGELALSAGQLAEIRRMTAEDASGSLDSLFVRVYGPPWEMLIIGAVHTAQALAPMATLAGYRVTVVDPRSAFATPERFPGVALVHDWPNDALAARPPNARTAVITLTHDPKIDDVGLIAALRSPAFFIGALGSTRTHAKRLARLSEEGFGEAELARIAAPVGLDLGGRLPGEIATAVVAEVVAARHGRRRQRHQRNPDSL